MSTENNYKHLEHRPGDIVRQPYIKGIKIRADTLYSDSIEKIDDDGNVTPGRTPEEIAADYGPSLEAVREAIDWCEKHSTWCWPTAPRQPPAGGTGDGPPGVQIQPQQVPQDPYAGRAAADPER